MKSILILSILIGMSMSVFTTSNECTCTQLLAEGDCVKQSTLGCAWDKAKQLCFKDTSTPVTPTTIYATYCEQFSQTDCPKQSGCQWYEAKCTHFTGCTAYQKTVDSDCQSFSNHCITDGVHCVEKGSCNTFLKQLPCVVNQVGKYCFWDTSVTPNVCIDASKCEYLPITLLTDEQCRNQIYTCTTKTGGGCKDSGVNCADQESSAQCYFNKDKTKECFWNGTACVDKTCNNALITVTTDLGCTQYLSTCTTKKDGGCVTRGACTAATNQESCKTNSSGNLCYWNSTNTCVDKNCAAAPLTYTTNKQCGDFVTGCITKKGGGCKQNTTCSSADIDVGCVTNSTGGLCIWNNNLCVDKICTNAPNTNNTHDLCTTFMPSCTVNATNNGCRIRTCDNASTDYDTNDKCNTYLSGCITKTGGGCVINTTCTAVGSLEKACVKDVNNNLCVFDTTCKDKTCANAPSTNNTHALCQQYMNTCTVNSANNGCIDMICENIQQSTDCIKDKSSNVCLWKGTCYKKQCKQASITYTTYQECQDFMSSCTVDNDGYGCMEIPSQCSIIQSINGCVRNKNDSSCAWSQNKCQDKSCLTAPNTTTTTTDCNNYKLGCIVNNTNNGCIDPLVTQCNARQLEENCNVSTGPVCLWDPTVSPKCIKISCATATQSSITTPNGNLTDEPDFGSCNTYLNGCILNNLGNGCQEKATTCSSYSMINCSVLANGNECYYNNVDSICVDKQCQNIKEDSHQYCEEVLSSCTYGDGIICSKKQAACANYTINQCHSTLNGKVCIWDSGICRDQTCSDAPDTDSYNTHTECNTFINTCTVLDRVDNVGCVSLQPSCSDYKDSAQCVIDSSGNDCIWNYDICVLSSTIESCYDIRGPNNQFTTAMCKSIISTCKQNLARTACISLTCADLTQADGYTISNSACAGYLSQCTNNSNGVQCITRVVTCDVATQSSCTTSDAGACVYSNATCSASSSGSGGGGGDPVVPTCAVKTGSSMTYSDCHTYLATCSVNLAGTACIIEAAHCGGYLTQPDCRKSGDGNCKWTGSCSTMSTLVCEDIVGTGLTLSACADFDNTCTTLFDLSGCQTIVNCSTYDSSNKCTNGSDGTCYWNGTDSSCTAITGSNCNIITGTNLSNYYCGYFHDDCYANLNGTACYAREIACTTYENNQTCTVTTLGQKCYWLSTGNGTCIAIASASTDCLKVQSANLANADCQSYNSSCRVNNAGTACKEYKSSCSGYQSSGDCGGTSSDGKCYYYSTACIAITTPSTDCLKVTGVGLSKSLCQSYNSGCTVNSANTACIEYKSQCSGYGLAINCYQTNTERCVWYNNQCISIATDADCSKVTGIGLTFDSCQSYNLNCIANAAKTACEPKSCSNKPNTTGYTHQICNDYLSTCTSNQISDETSCIPKPVTCSLFTTQITCGISIEGLCLWVPGVVANTGFCTKKTCSTAAQDTNFNTHNKCNTYLNTCTVAKVGGCSIMGKCTTYKTKFQCQAVGTCFWNERLNYGCVDRSCDKIEVAYNTHTLCNETNIGCTVKANTQGCIALTTCSSYTIQDQCHISNVNSKPCLWIAGETTSTCVDQSCSTADNTHTTHESCYDYYSPYTESYSELCTVKVTDIDGTPTPQGCIPLVSCTTYTSDKNCIIDNEGVNCVWVASTSTCAYKACNTAPETEDYDTDSECRTYLSTCTVNITGTGCITRPDKCDGMTELQCVNTSTGKSCQWFDSKCVDKVCETAPTDVITAEGCNTYLEGCTMEPDVKCKTQLCEDFMFTNDTDCEKAKTGCTSNGEYCVSRTTCVAANQYGCITQYNGALCQWNTSTSICVLRTCLTAPNTDDYITEQQCSTYLTGCTTKSGKGCIIKSNCISANIEGACTTAIDGTKCVWDNGKCRNIDCQDYVGTTYAECQLKGKNCTAGLNGKCIQLSNCENVVTRSACVYGLNGPCLWIESLNQCFQHLSCQSRSWNSDFQCKMISNQCTTNGTNCQAITSCSESNINGGCKTGYDGNCIQTVSILGSTNPPICKIYTSCTDAYYTTHSDCQMASNKCTTNGITSCIPLAQCQTYTIQESCQINETGASYDKTTGDITLTGVCKWDTTATTPLCRDQVCSDLTGTSHYSCSNQLGSCTSDGTNCLTKGNCSTYKTQQQCEFGYGSDGPQGECLWEIASTTNNNTPNCRIMKCSDILNGTTTQICQASLTSCVSDGTICIPKAKCSTYTTEQSCHSDGTDGKCVFKSSSTTTPTTGTCQLMTSCAQANNDSVACAFAKDRCSWTPSSGTGATAVASKCAIHTCATFASTNTDAGCSTFYSWDQLTQQICTLVKGVCQETDASTLTNDSCYSLSKYTYTWNPSSNKCSVCTTTVVVNNSNGTNATTTTEDGYLLGLSSIIIGYLMF